MSEEWATVNTSPTVNEEEKVEFEIETEEVDASSEVSEERVQSQKTETQVETKQESAEEPEEQQSGAQKRIRQLVKQKKEREEHIQSLIARQQELEERLKNQQQEIKSSLEKNFEAAETQINSRIEMAEDAYRQALESGEADRIVAAQKNLNNAQGDATTLKITKSQYRPEEEEQQQETKQAPQQQQKAVEYDKLAMEWAGRNPWFGQDNVMTTLALEVDAELKLEGFDPTEEDFYGEIDSRLKNKFPQRFEGQTETTERQQETSSPAQVVGGASRTSSASSGKKVRLTKEDVRLAEKWGIPLEQYAAEKLKVDKAEGEYTTVY